MLANRSGSDWRERSRHAETVMLMELTIIPLGGKRSISADISQLVGFIGESGLPYQVTAFGTLVEGSWDQLMEIAKKCHTAIRKKADRVLILIRLDDYAGRTDLLVTAVAHVEQKLGRSVKH